MGGGRKRGVEYTLNIIRSAQGEASSTETMATAESILIYFWVDSPKPLNIPKRREFFKFQISKEPPISKSCSKMPSVF